jgi:hypothetical protein
MAPKFGVFLKKAVEGSVEAQFDRPVACATVRQVKNSAHVPNWPHVCWPRRFLKSLVKQSTSGN